MRFKGKVSWWFYAIIFGVAAIILPIIFVSTFVDKNNFVVIINLIVLAALEIFCIPIVFRNYVELQKDDMLIVFGLIKKKISYSDIIAVSTTNDPQSSLAASFDRIEIKRKNKDNIMIAVTDRERFLNEIRKYRAVKETGR